jgi:hypothetical protein
MSKLIFLFSIFFLALLQNSKASDLYNSNNGQLTVEKVLVGTTVYTNVVIKLDRLISVGNPPRLTNYDVYDPSTGQLSISEVIANGKIYNNVVITLASVISIGSAINSDISFSSNISDTPASFYFAKEIGSEITSGVIETYKAAILEWGNFGSFEYWGVGVNPVNFPLLSSQYCSLRILSNQDTSQSCNAFVNDPKIGFEYYRQVGSNSINNKNYEFKITYSASPSLGYQKIISSFPSSFSYGFYMTLWHPDVQIDLAREYWHVIQNSFIPNSLEKSGDTTSRSSLLGPKWFYEGSATYLSNWLVKKSQASGAMSLVMGGPVTSMHTSFGSAMASSLKYLSNNPNIKTLDDISSKDGQIASDLGAWAIAYLINRSGNEKILLNTFLPNLKTLGWEGAFNLTFKQSSIDFYREFNTFLKLPVSDQLKVLPLLSTPRPIDQNFIKNASLLKLGPFQYLVPAYDGGEKLIASWTPQANFQSKPTFVIVHGGGGVGGGEFMQAVRLRDQLNANVLLLDSFGTRGPTIQSWGGKITVDVDIRVGDAVAAGRFLNNLGISSNSTYLIGGSQGGWTVERSFTDEAPFNTQIPNYYSAGFSKYPVCYVDPLPHRNLGPYTKPVIIFSGGLDGYPISQCQPVTTLSAFKWINYPLATHAWDSPADGALNPIIDGKCVSATSGAVAGGVINYCYSAGVTAQTDQEINNFVNSH